MSTLKNKLTSLLLLLVVLTIALTKQSCKKIEKEETAINRQEKIEKFFRNSQTVSSTTKRVINEIKKNQEKNNSYIPGIIEKNGYPLWNKAIVKTNNSNSSRTTNTPDTVVLIPIIQNNQPTVSSYIEAHVANNVQLSIYRDIDYKTYPNGTFNSSLQNAEKYAMEFILLEAATFDRKRYLIKDTNLFKTIFPNLNRTTHQLVYVADSTQPNSGRIIMPTGCSHTFQSIYAGNDGIFGTGDDEYGTLVVVYDADCLGGSGGSGGGGTGTGTGTSYGSGFGSGSGTGSGTGSGGSGTPTGGSGGGGTSGGSLGWTTYYYPIVNQAAGVLSLSPSDKDWLNSQSLNISTDIVNFVAEADYIAPVDDDVYILDEEARQSGRALVRTIQNNTLTTYDETSYDVIKQFAPIINGSNAQQADIFWSNFSLHSSISKENNTTYSNNRHWLYAFYNVWSYNNPNSLTGVQVGNLTNNFYQSINGLGLNASFTNTAILPSPIPVNDTLPKRLTVTKWNGKKTELVWIKKNGIITFGNRNQLKEITNLTPVCHHIIPVNVCEGSSTQPVHQAIQALAKKYMFHMNQAENGVSSPVAGAHPNYDSKVRSKLDGFWTTQIQNDINSTNSIVAQAAYTTLKNNVFALMLQIKNLFLANPTLTPTQIATLF